MHWSTCCSVFIRRVQDGGFSDETLDLPIYGSRYQRLRIYNGTISLFNLARFEAKEESVS